MNGAFGKMSSASLDGTWGGTQNGLCAQIIVVGASVIGFYWRDEYLPVSGVAFSADGCGLSFDFERGNATLTRSGGERSARLDVSEGGHVVNLCLQRD